MSPSSTVVLRWPAEHVAELVMDRPEALNALSTAQAKALTVASEQLVGRSEVGAVVLSSALSTAFCVGADLKERSQFTEDDLRQQRPVFVTAFAAVADLPMPTIAAVDGFALGGGCELALACDLIVASETAVFALPEVGLGLVPGGGGTQRLPRRVGPGRAAELIFTGRRVAAEEAVRIGLADRLVPAGQARAEALQLATEIGAKSPVSVRAAKRALRAGADRTLTEGLALEDEAWRAAAFTADRVEGVAAFVEHRTPDWPSWRTGVGS